MPRSAGTSVENNFSRGLITEATAMNYPENSVVETNNCVFLKNGTVLRRNGIDLESSTSHTFASLNVLDSSIVPDYDNVAINEFEWVTLGDNGNKTFLVVQVGDVLRFFEVDDTNSASEGLETFFIDITEYRTTPVLATEVASVVGNVVVDDALISSLTGTLTVTVGAAVSTITMSAGTINTKAEFEDALDIMSIALGIEAKVNSSNFLSISALENDLTLSFTVGGTLNILTAFGVAETLYEPDTEDAYEAVARRKCYFSSGLGYLFVVHPYCEPFFVEYDDATNTISVTLIEIKTRDFERLDDDLDVDERPAALTNEHWYNIYNQGWYASGIKYKETTAGADDGAEVEVMSAFNAANSTFPSNSDIWWLFKNAADRFDPTVETVAKLSTPAPNGHYIHDAFQTNRRNITGHVFDGIAERSSGPHRPSSTAFFASRVWYAGVNTDDFTSSIYFSKLIENKRDFGTCYQAADPTAEDLFDLQETDGGVIVIPDIVEVTGLFPLGRALLVFASNGVWAISGTQGGFKANDYAIRKISSTPVDAAGSIVIAESSPFWWSRSGIYTIIVDPNSGELTVENISDNTIKTHTQTVPASNIQNVKGVYNTTDKTIQWLYRTQEATTIIQNYQYTHILVHDLISKSFSVHTLPDSLAYISGAVHSAKSSYDPLVTDEGSSATLYIVTGDFGASSARVITTAKFSNTDFVDWLTVDGTGVDFESYFITGYRVRAELLRKFQSNYLVIMAQIDNDNYDDYGCLVQGIWDYNNSSEGRLTNAQQVYSWSYKKDYSRRKLKMRGNGYSLQFKFTSETGKRFNLVGWVSSESAGNVP